ncbi:MAG TPA: tyrosine-type recombinase/integrase, partial [Candidatus Marinimicrobia bacterium]|nr:tyrosine-type recombinase/integrase [Candidatus Neomarinimicrobiota bacterium]
GTKLVMKTCFTYINLHPFRQTYARNMLNKGVFKEVLQILLGHRSIKTTEIDTNWVEKDELEEG